VTEKSLLPRSSISRKLVGWARASSRLENSPLSPTLRVVDRATLRQRVKILIDVIILSLTQISDNLHAYEGGDWQENDNLHVYEGGDRQESDNLHAYEGGDWQENDNLHVYEDGKVSRIENAQGTVIYLIHVSRLALNISLSGIYYESG
jgi:hypothetical protein